MSRTSPARQVKIPYEIWRKMPRPRPTRYTDKFGNVTLIYDMEVSVMLESSEIISRLKVNEDGIIEGQIMSGVGFYDGVVVDPPDVLYRSPIIAAVPGLPPRYFTWRWRKLG